MILSKKGLINYLKLFRNFKPEFLFSFANKELFFKANNNWLFKGILGKEISLEVFKSHLPKNNIEDPYLPLEEIERIYTVHKSFVITKQSFYFIKNKKLICEIEKNSINKINQYNQRIELELTKDTSFGLRKKINSYGSYKLVRKLTFDFVNNKYFANSSEVTEKMFFRLIKEFKKTSCSYVYYSPTKKRYFGFGGINQHYNIQECKIVTTEKFNSYFFRENICVEGKTFYYFERDNNVIINKCDVFPELENKLKINFFSYFVKEKFFNYATQETYFLLCKTEESSKYNEEAKYIVIDFNKKMYAVLTEEKLNMIKKSKIKALLIKKELLKWRLEND